MEMTLEPSLDGKISFHRKVTPNESIEFVADNLRREHTGLHGLIVLFFENTLLCYDTFNVGRQEERIRLAKAGHADLSPMVKEAYPLATLRADLDRFCALVTQQFDHRFTHTVTEGKRQTEGSQFTAWPFVLSSGGTILYAPPKSGKSYIALLLAQSIHQGVKLLWPAAKRPILFVNLERSQKSLEHRLAGINLALGLAEATPLPMLHARGRTMREVRDSIAHALRATKAEVLFWDSISRMGLGSMSSDESANSGVDALNSLCETWVALGHTPRDDSSHQYGSVMFQAGEDLGVSLKSQRKGNELGVMLKVTESNDTAIPPPFFYTLQFQGSDELSWLAKVEKADKKDWPDLALPPAPTRLARIKGYLELQGESTGQEIAKALNLDPGDVSKLLHDSSAIFEAARREGHSVWWRLKGEPVSEPDF